jgi:hypothetical protein
MADDESYPAPHWAHWLARDLWRLDQAVALSLRIEPSSVFGDYVRIPGMDSRELLGDIPHVPGMLLRARPLPAEYHERLAITEACAGISLRVGQERPNGKLVEPAHFVVWARSKGFTLPSEFDEPTSRAPAASPTSKPEAASAGNYTSAEKSSLGAGQSQTRIEQARTRARDHWVRPCRLRPVPNNRRNVEARAGAISERRGPPPRTG